MSGASLGPSLATAIAQALAGAATLPALAGGGQIALTVGSADPATPPVEVAYSGYGRANTLLTTTGSTMTTSSPAFFDLPAGITVSGVVLVSFDYPDLTDPLLWFDLPTPLVTAEEITLAVPAGAVRFTALAQA